MKPEYKTRLVRIWREWISGILLVIVLTTSFRSAIADWNDVPSGSMIPTILEGDRIFVNKLAYDLKFPFTTRHLASWDNPRRGDIVVFYSPADERRLVKRVVGLPGDILSMKDNQLLLNGEAISYDSLDPEIMERYAPHPDLVYRFYTETLGDMKHPVMLTPALPSRRSFDPVRVPERGYFMMGDNRDNSGDSRYFGFVERDRILGRVVVVVLSVRREDYYLPRWDRFFHSLP